MRTPRFDPAYRAIVEFARGLTIIGGLKLHLHGTDKFPATGGAVVVINHTGYFDFILGGIIPRQKKRLVHYMAKAAVFAKPVAGQLLQLMGHIPVDRVNGAEAMKQAVATAADGRLVGIFPEATISRSFEIRPLRTGAVRIAQEAGVPIIPMVIFGSQRLWTKGASPGRPWGVPVFIETLDPFDPSGDPQERTEELRTVMQQGIEKLWQRYEDHYGPMPAGAPWVPARRGGSAPTFEQAQAEDAIIEAERSRLRQLGTQLTQLSEQLAELRPAAPAAAHDAEAATAAAHDAEAAPAAAIEAGAQLHADITELASAATAQLREGHKRIEQATTQLLSTAAQVLDTADAASSAEQLWPLWLHTRSIYSRLPHQVRNWAPQLPDTVVLSSAAFQDPSAGLQPAEAAAFAALSQARQRAGAGTGTVVLSDGATATPELLSQLSALPGWQLHRSIPAELELTAPLAAGTLVIAATDADPHPAGAVVLASAPADVVRAAAAIGPQPSDSGLAQLLSAVAHAHSSHS